MSLVHWWPLRGDLTNLVDISNPLVATNTSVNTVTSDGKIGNTYTNTSNSSGSLVSQKAFLLPQTQSMFCWLYMTNVYDWANLNAVCGQHRYETNSGMGITIRYNSSTSGYLSVNTGNGSSRTYNSYYGSTLLSAGKWYHVGYTYDGSKIRLYVNGKLDGTHDYTGQKQYEEPFGAFMWSFASGTIGDRTPYADYIMKGKLNDIRVYDHTLSDLEVKELSKALVVHYTFNDTLSESTTNLLPTSLQNKYVENVADAASYTITSELTASAYTLSANIKRHIGDQSPSPYVSLFVTYSDGTSENITTTTAVDGYDIRGTADGQFHYYVLTVFNTSKKTVTKVNGWILDRGSYTSGTPRYMTIQNAQLEAKDHATPYTPSSREGTPVNEAGYNYNIDNCGFVLSKDAAKGSYSSYYKNGEQYLISKSTLSVSFRRFITLSETTQPDVSMQVFIPFSLHLISNSLRKSICNIHSPPENVTPPPEFL